MNKLLSIIFSILFSVQSFAQVTFKATSEKVVEVGEMFRLSFTVNASATGFRAPKISDFRVLSGPNSSTSQIMTVVNGKMLQTIETGYTYTLLAEKEGKFTIGAALVTVDGKTYTSNEIAIEVIKSGAGATPSPQNGTSGNDAKTPSSEELFLNVSFNKTEIYQGEPLVAAVKIYAKDVELRDLGSLAPTYTGFWRAELPSPSRISLQREKFNNKIYNSGLLRQDLLIPQNSGKLNISPMEIEAIYQYKIGQRRDFFGRIVDVYDNKQTTVSSSSRTITVKPLPAGKPENFSGLVGSEFKISASLTNESIKTDEGTTLKLTVSGNGNIKLFDMQALTFQDGLDAYPPEMKDNTSVNSAGTTGAKIFSYFILARKPGNYTLPPVSISYFDLKSESFKTLSTDSIRLNVSKGDNYSETKTSELNTETMQSEVVNLDTDIRYLKSETDLYKTDSYFAGSTLFYLLYLLLFAAFVIPVIIFRKRIKQNADIAAMKNRKAAKISKQRLAKAEQFMKQHNNEAFYKEILTALWGYVSDKYSVPVSQLSKPKIIEIIDNQELSVKITTLLEKCEYAQYASADAENQPEKIYQDAVNFIGEIEKLNITLNKTKA